MKEIQKKKQATNKLNKKQIKQKKKKKMFIFLNKIKCSSDLY